MPDRRRLRLAALRLRAAAAGVARPDRAGGRGASSSTCAGTRAAGIGLGHKIRAYQLQEEGHDTVDANLQQGLPVDSREYGIGAQMLVDLGVTTMRLMTNNPVKYGGLEGFGLDITERVPLQTSPNRENIAYLRTKRERMGHLLHGLDGAPPSNSSAPVSKPTTPPPTTPRSAPSWRA